MDGIGFVISASEAVSMARSSGLPSVLHLLPTLVRSGQDLARPPISSFAVAAVGLSSDGRVFLGVNLEFPGVPLHHSVHAEQFLVTNLSVHSAGKLLAFAVSAAPCGHCRQFLQELRSASDIQISIPTTNTTKTTTSPPDLFKPLSSILPNPFGPFDLLDKNTPLILESHYNGLSIVSAKSNCEPKNPCNGNYGFYANNNNNNNNNSECEELEIAALEAANNSHSPYSGSPSGVALRDSQGLIYRGSYMESAAYNPSLGPVQAAIVAYVAGGGGGYERIVAAVLVEKEGAVVKQEETARLLLKVISPKCELRVVHCISASNGCKTPPSNGYE